MAANHEYGDSAVENIVKINNRFADQVHWVILGRKTDSDPTGDKIPVDKAWQKQPPSEREVQKRLVRRGTVGVMPWSLGCVVIDIDRDLEAAAEMLTDYFDDGICFTKSRKGLHGWVKTGDERLVARCGNKAWYMGSKRVGEFRGCKGYVVLWDPSDAWRKFVSSKGTADEDLGAFYIEHCKPDGGAPKASGHEAVKAAPAPGANRNMAALRESLDDRNPPRPDAVVIGEWPGDPLGAEGGRHNNLIAQMTNAFNYRWPGGVELATAAAAEAFTHAEAVREVEGALAHAGKDTPDPRDLPDEEQWNGKKRAAKAKRESVKQAAEGTAREMVEKLSLIGVEVGYETCRQIPIFRQGGQPWRALDPNAAAVLRDRLVAEAEYRLTRTAMEKDRIPALSGVDECQIHFARDYLDSLPVGDEDDVKFLEELFFPWGAEDNPVNRYGACCLFAGAVHRIYNPNRPMRGFVTIVGHGDLGKSEFPRSMFPPAIQPWCYTDEVNFEKGFSDVSRTIEGFSIAEIPESAGTKKVDKEAYKKWLTQGARWMRVLHSNLVKEYQNTAYLVLTANSGELFLQSDEALSKRLVTVFLTDEPSDDLPDPVKWMKKNRERCWSAAKYLVHEKGWDFRRHPRALLPDIMKANSKVMFVDESLDAAARLIKEEMIERKANGKKAMRPGEAFEWLKESAPELAGFAQNPTRLGTHLRRQPWCEDAGSRRITARASEADLEKHRLRSGGKKAKVRAREKRLKELSDD